MPPEGKEIEKQLMQVRRDKEAAIREQDFEKAANLRDEETELIDKLEEIRKELNGKDKEDEKKEEDLEPMILTEKDVATVVSRWSGVPVGDLTESESNRLQGMEEILHERVVGQEEAIKAVSRAIRRARVGLKNPNRPIGTFIFAGPTGVGKTELAKALASFFFNSEEAIIRVDMSEFMERHTTSRLVGSPPGYVGYGEGGELTEKVRRRPYSVVLFDEIEKAHPDVFNVMLQILDDGRLTDSKGRVVSFKNTIVIMTSNVGAKSIENDRQIGFSSEDSVSPEKLYKRMQSKLMEDMRRTFRPEFLNRIDEIIIFHRLNMEHLIHIFDLLMKSLALRVKEKNFEFDISQEAKEFLCKESQISDRPGVGINVEGKETVSRDGARPLLRIIQRELENPLAEKILSKEIIDGDLVKIGLRKDSDNEDEIDISVVRAGAIQKNSAKGETETESKSEMSPIAE